MMRTVFFEVLAGVELLKLDRVITYKRKLQRNTLTTITALSFSY